MGMARCAKARILSLTLYSSRGDKLGLIQINAAALLPGIKLCALKRDRPMTARRHFPTR
jgi:hypothetical protein